LKVTFVAIGAEQLAISLLAGIAKREGHDVSLAYSASLFHDRWNLEIPFLGRLFDDSYKIDNKIEKVQPDVLVFSALTATYQWSLSIARKAKEKYPNIKTIFGGVHISAVPERTIRKPAVDFAVVGEGDVAFIDILNAILDKNFDEKPINNTLFLSKEGKIIRGLQKGFNQELDELHFFDKSLWEDHIRIEDKYMTMASRGCPYKCSFCFNNFFAKLPEEKSGKYVRIRSVDHMIAELLWAKKRYKKLSLIDFQDDVFTTDKKWLKLFLERYKQEINIPFQCLTHPKYMDEEITRWLSDAGCVWIQMGVQSMDDEFKRKHLQRYERSDNIEEACRLMKQFGIKAKLDHMFGLPDEPISAQEKALNLYKKHPPSRIQTFWTCYLPGTDMLREGIESGQVTAEEAERLYEGMDFFFYRNDDNIKNPKMVKIYKNYELIFKILPILPKKLRSSINQNSINFIPTILANFFIFFTDIFTGFYQGNPDFGAYAKHYIFHMKNSIYYKLFRISRKATVPKNNITPEEAYNEVYASKVAFPPIGQRTAIV
jgi:anaerobic magnesium-protoporphyrin IX monomethyl ester cyclase